MKLIEAIKQTRGNRVPKRVGRITALQDVANTTPLSMSRCSDNYEVRFTATIGCSQVGPLDALEIMQKRAEKMIAREAFGELCDDLYTLREILWEEEYRPSDDPAMVLIGTMIAKTQGE